MTWKLFIDDIRLPKEDGFEVARTSIEACHMLDKWGMPEYIAFDHDLGGTDTSIRFIIYMEHQLSSGRLTFPHNFMYSIHSMNPVGRKNIVRYMDSLIGHKDFGRKSNDWY